VAELNEVGGEPINPNKMNERIEKAHKEVEAKFNMPDGYIEVRLSTRGKVGAPEKFYIRNFSPEDLMSLGLADKEDIPIKLIKVLDSLIYNPDNNKDLSIENWHEKEVIELLLLLYETFYTTVFANQEWILTEEDWDFIAEQHGGRDTDGFRANERAIKNKTVKHVFDIDISTLDFYEIPDDFKVKVRIDRKYAGKPFAAIFTLPRFGDFIKLKQFIDII